MQELRRTREERDQTRRRNEQLEKENQQLQEEIKRLRKDLEAAQRATRRQAAALLAGATDPGPAIRALPAGAAPAGEAGVLR